MDIRYLIPASLLLISPLAQAAPPVANQDSRTIPTGVSVTINVLANDSDPDGDGIRVISVNQPQTENATVVLNSDGGIQVVPNAGVGSIEPEFIRFSYTVQDDSEQGEQAVGDVEIYVVPNAISNNASGPNNYSVAQALDVICGELTGPGYNSDEASLGTQALAERCEGLLSMDADARAEAIQQITPEETLALKRLGTNASKLQGDMVGARLSQLGQGINTASRNRLSWSTQPSGGAAGDADGLMAKFGVFASVQLEDAEKDRSLYEAGFDYRSNAFTVGADYALSNDWFIGAAGGLTTNDLDYKNDDGKVSADIFTFIGYTTYNRGNFSLDVQLGYSSSEIDISRKIGYGEAGVGGESFSATTEGETSGSEVFLSTQAQYLWAHKALSIYPRARLNFSSSEIKGYADNGAGGWEVILGDQSIDRWTFEAGVQSTYALTTSWGVIIPNLDFNLIADLNTDQELMTGYFAFAPESSLSFALEAEDPDSLYYQVGLGFSTVLPRGSSAYAGLRQTFGYEDFSSTQFYAGFRMEF
ncbi:MAG: autotransporter domain-containing protein [Cellvibrionaceae bacterium]|nr:autotransporter domain-containing protein [Cellvibrionaceae bacterium]